MKLLTTIRYEVFHDNTDTAHEQDWVCLTAMIHDGSDFIVYESSYHHKNRMLAAEWDELMKRIKTAAESSLCEVNHSKIMRDTCECTTYTVSVYGEG